MSGWKTEIQITAPLRKRLQYKLSRSRVWPASHMHILAGCLGHAQLEQVIFIARPVCQSIVRRGGRVLGERGKKGGTAVGYRRDLGA